MNKKDARTVAETITNEQIQQMFDNAKENITDWTKVSSINKGITKGVAWNVLAKDFDLEGRYHILAKTYMVREFGDHLPEELKPKKKPKKVTKKPTHHDPIFTDNED
jgi:hypothetical protein